ncbi:periplasmic chaperone for outer membrane proteins Skp [Sphingobacterium allocomposti]|jgi:outer membrane protein|uniref:Periplasmic chaperone for outer membrane proteins Skp n=1 Tax=Sphingobacterium allocomposti TaxID=415956 RepID=A0A5S5DKL6_9SPHI|nr:OmpH family outer membrane protein [Sphingobacterium composti Yoo et al. 2007 non Ten et al. 2007]TYP96154.1 periplasmic chaperone for outer membrane proteins Skp [Sphingobacterium composti Yoo et al. 2007 non Ten et al. 2007]HLS94947.1 OmpH family outer membrane protein [Sphingobacterium sp.]
MNKLFPTLSKVSLGLVLAVAAVSCNQNAKTAGNNTASSDSTLASTASAQKEEKIVYVNSDTLSEKYEYFKDIRAKLEAKVKKAQSDLQSKGQAFQREVAEYQQKAATMSASERQATEEKLARKQDELGRLDQNASASIAQDESTEFNNVYNTITEYLKKHAEENGYTLVLTYSKSNPTVLYVDKKLDITAQVIDALNKEYKEKKAKEKK